MKYLTFLLAALLLTTTAASATPVSQKAIQAYAASCARQPSPTLDSDPATKTQFCECTALYIQKTMTLEEIKAQAGNDQAARDSLNKIVTQVYAPCLQYPVRALVNKKCQANPETAGRAGVCACASDNIAAYTQSEAQKKLPELFASNPNITDPSSAFMSTPEFEAAEKQIADACGKATAQ